MAKAYLAGLAILGSTRKGSIGKEEGRKIEEEKKENLTFPLFFTEE